MENVDHYGCLTNKWLEWLEVLVSDVSFHYC